MGHEVASEEVIAQGNQMVEAQHASQIDERALVLGEAKAVYVAYVFR